MAKKILASIWTPLLAPLESKLDEACLRRDRFLDRTYLWESQALLQEVKKPNSAEARTYISRHLALLPRTPVTLMFSEQTIERINDACESRNIPRDSFINRVLLFLVAGNAIFEDLIEIDWDRAKDKVVEEGDLNEFGWGMLNGSLSAVAKIASSDPFWVVRRCIESARHEEGCPSGLHGIFIDKDLLRDQADSCIGFNCYVHDSQIEGHPQKIVRQSLSELLGNVNDQTRKVR